MLLLLDSARLDDIRLGMSSTRFAGVTTNPSLVAKQNRVGSETGRRAYINLLQAVRDAVPADCHLSVEVMTLNALEMVSDAKELVKHLPGVHIKVPVLPSTLSVISALRDSDIAVNATACMNAAQAHSAALAGADIVSFFFNRMVDYRTSFGGINPRRDALQELARFASMRDRTPSIKNVRSICGSIRKCEDVLDCWEHGADYVTASLKVADDLVSHPKTMESVLGFQKDIDAWLA